jgi:hypothetical protein
VQDVCNSPRTCILQQEGGYISASDIENIDEGVDIVDPFEESEVDYALESEEDPSPCEILELATRSAPTISENESKDNEKFATLMQGENSFDEPNLSNDHALQGMR